MIRKLYRRPVKLLLSIGLAIPIVVMMFTCKPRNKSRIKGEPAEETFSPLTGGSCSTSGNFTQAALAQAKAVRQQIEAFKDNASCSGVSAALAKLPEEGSSNDSGGQAAASGMNLFAMSQEIQALRRLRTAPNSYHGQVTQEQVTSLLNQRLFQMIGVEQSGDKELNDNPAFSSVRKDLDLAFNQKKRVLRTASETIGALGDLFDGLSVSANCPINQPNVLGSVATASVKLLGAYAGADPGLAMKIQSSLQKFMNWSRQSYFRDAIKSIDQTELGLTLSCLLETSANGYCSVRDHQALQKDSLKNDERALMSLRGYVIFNRELPILTKWLIQLKSNQASRKQGEVQEQIANMQVPVELQKKRIQIASSIRKTAFDLNTTNQQTARSEVYDLLYRIDSVLSEGMEGVPNYFDTTYPPSRRFFSLLKLPIPPEVSRSSLPETQEGYFQRTQYASIGNPQVALNTIQGTVNEMFAEVSGQLATYLRRNSNQDAPLVISDFERPGGVNVSPRQVLINIQNYMLDILQSINENAKRNAAAAAAERPMAALLVETIKKIDRILEASDAIRNTAEEISTEVEEILKRPRRTNLSLTGNSAKSAPDVSTERVPADRNAARISAELASMTAPLGDGAETSIAAVQKAVVEEKRLAAATLAKSSSLSKVFDEFRNLGAVVVTELDMDNQQEMLIVNRLARVVQYDLQRLMRSTLSSGAVGQFSTVTQALLVVSNDLMTDRFETVFNSNPQSGWIDLASASIVSKNTLEALGSDPTSTINPFGSSNPIVNSLKTFIGILSARTVGGARTGAEVAEHIGDQASAESLTDEFFAGLMKTVNAGFYPPIRMIQNVYNQRSIVDKVSWNDALLSGVMTTPDKWAFVSRTMGRWMRPDLYWTPGWWSGMHKARMFVDDEFGSMATLRAFLCMQTLAMPDPRSFQQFCKGAILYSVHEDPEVVDKRVGQSVVINPTGGATAIGLSLIYDDWLNAYLRSYKQTAETYFTSQRICAVYDNFRANQIYFLTKPQRDEEIMREWKAKQQQ